MQAALAPAGAAHALHAFPQVAGSSLDLQSAPHLWNPGLHLESQAWLLVQIGVLLGTPLHAVHAVDPQDSTLLLSLHSFPQRWKPALHLKAHFVPSHVESASLGWAHGVQAVPHEVVALFGTQFPSQSCVPLAQTPLQALSLATHSPAHSLRLAGQAAPHLVPSQVAVPAIGVGQALHDIPQVSGSLSLTQASLHLWYAWSHCRAHLSPSQDVLPLAEVGQGVQEAPQKLRLVDSTQMPLQKFLPKSQVPSQGASFATQASLQSLRSLGHAMPQRTPSQVAEPPLTLGQGTHATPQLVGSRLSTQAPLQLCWPVGHSPISGIEAGVAAPSDSGPVTGASTGVAGPAVPSGILGPEPPAAPPGLAGDESAGQPPGSASNLAQSTVLRFRHAQSAVNPRRERVRKAFIVPTFEWRADKLRSDGAKRAIFLPEDGISPTTSKGRGANEDSPRGENGVSSYEGLLPPCQDGR
jgi:hypothetical protein